MCFHKISNDQKPQVAEQDIECFKYLYKDKLRSPIQLFQWKVGIVAESTIEDYGSEIEDGFHACKTEEDAQEYIEETEGNDNHHEYAIYKFKIPKGAEYYKNRTQYVSNKMVLVSAEAIVTFPEPINE